MLRASVKAAALAEKIAVVMRELTSDAESEVEVLKRVRIDTIGKRKRHDHHMVIHRQTENAIANYFWQQKDLEAAELEAEELMNVVLRDTRSTIDSGVVALEHKALTQEQSRNFVIAVQNIVTSFVEKSQVESMYESALRSKNLTSRAPRKEGHSNPTTSGVVSRNSETSQLATPYQIAMMSKIGPNILVADENNLASHESQSSPSARKRRRLWWPFRRSKRVPKSTSPRQMNALPSSPK